MILYYKIDIVIRHSKIYSEYEISNCKAQFHILKSNKFVEEFITYVGLTFIGLVMMVY